MAGAQSLLLPDQTCQGAQWIDAAAAENVKNHTK